MFLNIRYSTSIIKLLLNLMLFGGRSISPTPNNRTRNQLTRQISSRSPIRKMTPLNRNNHDSKNGTMMNNTKSGKQNLQKSKQYMGILYALQEVYSQLTFTEYDAFTEERIVDARNNLDKIITYYKDEPICPKHSDILNLYCENQKQVICVSCVYKGNQEHKNHKVKPLQSVEKSIEYETIRLQQKSKSLVSQLAQIHIEIGVMSKQICEDYMNISNNSVSIINQTIRELENLKQQYDKKLSVSYRRADTIINRYKQSIGSMIDIIDANIQKCSNMKGLGRYLVLKQVNKQSSLIEDLINKFYENKNAVEQWKKVLKETDRLMIKKKSQPYKHEKDDIYVVTKF